jgi:hypothetical protein
VQLIEAETRQEWQTELLPDLPLGPKASAAIRRVALSRALTTRGLLCSRRRRFALPMKRSILADIS